MYKMESAMFMLAKVPEIKFHGVFMDCSINWATFRYLHTVLQVKEPPLWCSAYINFFNCYYGNNKYFVEYKQFILF